LAETHSVSGLYPVLGTYVLKNARASVLRAKEYFYTLRQISTPLGIAQVLWDQQNRSTGKGKTAIALKASLERLLRREYRSTVPGSFSVIMRREHRS
jgi:hypothetical protein